MKTVTLVHVEEAESEIQNNDQHYTFESEPCKIGDSISFRDWEERLELLLEHHRNKPPLLFSSFAPFKENPEMLEVLSKSGIRFGFADFKNLNRNTVEALIEFLKISRREKSRKIKTALEKIKEEGKITLGNPRIGDLKGKAVRKRKLQALTDAATKAAWRAIAEIKEQSGSEVSFNQLAELLNSRGLTPRRGKRFYAKTVQRLIEHGVEVRSDFRRNTIREKEIEGHLANVNSGEGLQDLEVAGLEIETEFNHEITFEIRSPLQQLFQVAIYDNDNARVYRSEFEPGQGEITIDLDDAVLLPGRHYISIQTEEPQYRTFHSVILLRTDVLELAGS